MAAQTNFIDIATIWLHAGKGGDGAVSFHREKFVAAGGPDGGDGGRGGDIIFVVDDHLTTLMDFRYKRKYVAPEGGKGGASLCHGKNAENLVIKVPLGTVIKDTESGLVIADLSDHTPVTIAKGGRGGYGNAHFATPTRQIPKFAKPGMPGEDIQVTLELKLIADVGLIGFPNVGKSTLISTISAAKPKIANYHFTTLVPTLGVVSVAEGASFVCADIPGLIEGASEGIGLGHDFRAMWSVAACCCMWWMFLAASAVNPLRILKRSTRNWQSSALCWLSARRSSLATSAIWPPRSRSKLSASMWRARA